MSSSITYPSSFNYTASSTANDLEVSKLFPHHSLHPGKVIEIYEGPTWANSPSFLNILWAPGDFIATKAALKKSILLEDKEGELDARVRLSGAPISFVNGSLTLFFNLFQVGALCPDKFSTRGLDIFKKFAAILGICLCTIEGVFESIGIKRQHDFRKSLSFTQIDKEIAQLKKQNPKLKDKNLAQLTHAIRTEAAIKDLKHIQKTYFQLDLEDRVRIRHVLEKRFPHLTGKEKLEKYKEIEVKAREVKRNNLARRVKPWFATEIMHKLPLLMEKLNSRDVDVRKMGETECVDLMEKLDIQSRKKMIVHIVGLIALAMTVISLCVMTGGVPLMVAVALLVCTSVFSIGKSILSHGWLHSRGWEFQAKRGFSFGLCKPKPKAAG